VKKLIAVLCVGLFLAGCSSQETKAPQAPAADVKGQRQEAAKKVFAQSMLLLQQKNLKGAVENLRASIALDPTDPNPYLVLGQLLIKAEQFTSAVEFLDQAAKTFPDNGTMFYMLSVANKLAGNKLPSVLAARRSYEIFNASGDAANARTSAMLLEELVQEAQAEQKVTDAKSAADAVKVDQGAVSVAVTK